LPAFAQLSPAFASLCLILPAIYGTYKTVRARFWHWRSGQSRYNILSCFFARQNDFSIGGNCQQYIGLRCRSNLDHIRQSKRDSGSDFQVKVLTTFKVVPCSTDGLLDRGQGPAVPRPPLSMLEHIRQSKPDSGLGFQLKFLSTFRVEPSSTDGLTHSRQGRLTPESSPPQTDFSIGGKGQQFLGPRCRSNLEHGSQPDSGLGCQVKSLYSLLGFSLLDRRTCQSAARETNTRELPSADGLFDQDM